MYHYVYLLEFPNGMKYVGAHSTIIKPELDTCYLGSGKALPKDRSSRTCNKRIIAQFTTRAGAMAYEERYIIDNDCVASELWYNLRKRTFDKYGSTLSEEHKLLISKTHKGRDRSEYGKKYTGEGRTPAQRAGDVRAGNATRGTKNPDKGKPGIDNNGFTPWYYITPEGVYYEVHDKTRIDKAKELGFTPRQISHGFHYTNEHKKARTKPRKGWVFGALPRPADLIED